MPSRRLSALPERREDFSLGPCNDHSALHRQVRRVQQEESRVARGQEAENGGKSSLRRSGPQSVPGQALRGELEQARSIEDRGMSKENDSN